MKIIKSRIFAFVLGAVIFSGITGVTAYTILASDVHYKDTTLDKALDTLYTTQNTTVTNLQNQVNTLTNEKTSLQEQIDTKDATISNLQSQINSLTNSGGIEEICIVHRDRNGTSNWGKHYRVDGIVKEVTDSSTYIGCTYNESQNKWYFKAKGAGKYIIIYGFENPSISVNSYSANASIATISDPTLASSYGAVAVIKLK